MPFEETVIVTNSTPMLDTDLFLDQENRLYRNYMYLVSVTK